MKKEKESPTKSKGLEDVIDMADFNKIFKITGVSGLWVGLRVGKNKNLVILQKFGSKCKCTFSANLLQCLGKKQFITLAGHENLNILQVFTNIEAGGKDLDELVPNYDDEQFKDYHAKKLFEWYDILIKNNKNVEI